MLEQQANASQTFKIEPEDGRNLCFCISWGQHYQHLKIQLDNYSCRF
jgi:hypothetical protein